MIHESQKVAKIMHVLRRELGRDRVAQTKDRRCGKYCIVRIYQKPEDKGHPSKAIYTADTLAELIEIDRMVFDGQIQ